MPPADSLIRVALLISFSTVALGCSKTAPKPTLMANNARSDITVYQLRALDYEYAAQFGQLVAACVVDITEEASDPGVLEHAYQWRLWALPQARAASFDQDPFAGLLELWVLARQQRAFFTEGTGKTWFEPQQTCAPSVVEHLEREAELLVASVVPEERLDELSEIVRDWTDEHPIEGQLFVRPTARADLASFFSAESRGGLAAVGNMEETLRDLNDRITILTVQAPVEARWQAEYLVNSLFEERFEDRADTVVGAIDDITAFLDEFEGALSAQTATLLEGFTSERIAVFDAIEEERQMILSAVEEGRVSILDDLDQQVADATARLDSVGRGLIDHFFRRLIEVLVGMGIFVILVVLLVLVLVRRGSRRDD